LYLTDLSIDSQSKKIARQTAILTSYGYAFIPDNFFVGASSMFFTIILACADQSDESNIQKPPEQQTQEERKKLAEDFSQKAREETYKLLDSYEEARKLFVSDNIVGLEQHCDTIIKIAKQAEFAAPDNLKPKYTIVADKAKALKKSKQDDLEGARQDFGYLSKAIIEILKEEPSLQTEVYLFECPMAQDYKYWIQKSKSINNPYMGQKMLECGSTASF
jgi:hypothetical protein